MPEKTRSAIYRANKGSKRTIEVRKLLSLQKLGSKNPQYGKPAWNSGKIGLQIAWMFLQKRVN